MTPAEAASNAAQTLTEARSAAATYPDSAHALAAVAEQWTTLGATLASNPVMITEHSEKPTDGNMDRLEDGR